MKTPIIDYLLALFYSFFLISATYSANFDFLKPSLNETLWTGLARLGLDLPFTPITKDMAFVAHKELNADQILLAYQYPLIIEATTRDGSLIFVDLSQQPLRAVKLPLLYYLELDLLGGDPDWVTEALCYQMSEVNQLQIDFIEVKVPRKKINNFLYKSKIRCGSA